jgi:hypothetical protein
MPSAPGSQETDLPPNPPPMEVGAQPQQQPQLITDNDFTFFKKFKQYVSIITENERGKCFTVFIELALLSFKMDSTEFLVLCTFSMALSS